MMVFQNCGPNTAVVLASSGCRGDRQSEAGAGLVRSDDRVTTVVSDQRIASPQGAEFILSQKGAFRAMSRGNRLLGVVEMAEVLESMTPLIRRITQEDGRITEPERQLMELHDTLVTDSQSLAIRTQIGMSLVRGLEAPPERVHDLLDDYWKVYGPTLRLAENDQEPTPPAAPQAIAA
jgi:hypothetical protein